MIPLLIMAVVGMVLLLNAFTLGRSGAAKGPRATAVRYSVDCVTATETDLTVGDSKTRSYDRWLQAAIFSSIANAQYCKITNPTAWRGKEIPLLPPRLNTVREQPIIFPVQIKVPAHSTVSVIGYQDKGSNEVVTVILKFTDAPISGKPVGYLFGDMEAVTAGNTVPAFGTAVPMPVFGLGATFKCEGGVGAGAGAAAEIGGIVSSAIPTSENSGELGPHWPLAADVSLGAIPTPADEPINLVEGDAYTPWCQDLSAGAVRHIVYWSYGTSGQTATPAAQA